MSSESFETTRARYTVHFGVHDKPVLDPSLDKAGTLDAIVLEGYHTSKAISAIFTHPVFKKHYQHVIAKVRTVQETAGKTIPLFIADVLTTQAGIVLDETQKWGLGLGGGLLAYDGAQELRTSYQADTTRREFIGTSLRQGLKVLVGAGLASDLAITWYVVNSGHMPAALAKANSVRTHAVPTPRFELRNAIVAKKIEDGIVPYLGIAKPNIFVAVGAGHSGIVEDLKYRKLREFVLGVYSKTDYFGIDREHINTITELKLVGYEYSVKFWDSKLILN